jgi:hypothetical protein
MYVYDIYISLLGLNKVHPSGYIQIYIYVGIGYIYISLELNKVHSSGYI